MIKRVLLVAVVLLSPLVVFANLCDPPYSCAVCGEGIYFVPGGIEWVMLAKSDRLQEELKAGIFASTAIWTNSDTNCLDHFSDTNSRTLISYTNISNYISNTNSPKYLAVGVYLRLCEKCNKLPEYCYTCGLPIKYKDKDVLTSDGRWICKRDVPIVVLDEDGARELFESARDTAVDVIGDFFALKNTNVSVHITDVFDRKKAGSRLHTLAISKTTDTGSELVHYVSVYSGRPKHEAFYSCVHEYTHLWINENIHKHKIEKNTIEALCELVAYKVAESCSDAAEQKKILDNPYTKGRIKDLVQYAADEDLSDVINWVRNGKERTLSEGVATAAARNAKPPEIPLDVRIAEAQVARAKLHSQKQTLGLNGIIRSPKGPLVMLTGGLVLGKGEAGVVKLNGAQSHVRCIDIQSDSAVVELENATNAVRLKLSQ